MSDLFSGAACSAAANPLSQLSKHAARDASLQQDRLVPQNTSIHKSFRSAPHNVNQQDQQILFFGDKPAFGFDGISREIRAIQQTGREWSSEFQNDRHMLPPERAAHMESASRQRVPSMSPLHEISNPAWREEFSLSSTVNYAPQAFMPGNRMLPSFQGAFGSQLTQLPSYHEPLRKGKEKLVELTDQNWEEHFDALEKESQQERQEGLEESQDELMNQQFHGDFESIWNGIQQDNPSFSGIEDLHAFSINEKPDLGDYQFELDNPYLNRVDPFAEGLRLMESGASLSEVALCFEAAVQQDMGRAEAWTQLGLVQAQNEKEEPAIRALDKATNLESTNLQAMMGLAVSYTNEGYDSAAYMTLESWIVAKYPSLTTSIPKGQGRDQLHQRVTSQFIHAAQLSPNGAQMDADVQVGLGVLFYGSESYDKAVDCFTAALSSRPNDHLLWNRLGATLANSGRSEEAINAYHKALEISPSFVRARYNLGVSCINIGCYEEAAQHLLGALAQHQRGDVPGGVNISSNLWETLRRVFMCQDRRDLSELAITGTDVNIFREFFEF
ncbi:Peroxisomal targeting signal receptor [Neolecta irregularis DAH-3]|uniref:Peroxisomal targeting signal receptor n=1 Tax=Neolecta irregularis (strain DAH-3) TaxID=1198029 RepID=A0A1U7LV43_NEOID|nr:Peroxisomal targeting signal receptor [Neolecta irregularis DAH-3]|eukprot:OLL26546.1 Peroxisomal targeting signal receptor [Neolecta irregularis DAH-3]